MPRINDRNIQILHFGILLLCVPAQYLISKYYTASEGERVYALRNLYSSLVSVRSRWYLSWVDWCLSLLHPTDHTHTRTSPTAAAEDDEDGPGLEESPALEVIAYRQEQEENKYFGRSLEPRDSRPPHIKYRVGQVVRHRLFGYRGVIVGWDATAQAPAEWLEHNHPKDKPEWSGGPNYGLLVDTRDRIAPQLTYVPQDNIEPISHTQIYHPALEEFFESFDGVQYVLRPWLRTVYPYG